MHVDRALISMSRSYRLEYYVGLSMSINIDQCSFRTFKNHIIAARCHYASIITWLTDKINMDNSHVNTHILKSYSFMPERHRQPTVKIHLEK